MTAVHVFMGDNYYPMSGTSDYVTSFYSHESEYDSAIPEAITKAYEYVEKEFKDSRNDWWVIVVDEGEGLREHSYGYRKG